MRLVPWTATILSAFAWAAPAQPAPERGDSGNGGSAAPAGATAAADGARQGSALQQAREHLKAGRHQQALAEVSRGLRAPEVSEADQFALLMLRGETLLALQSPQYAAEAFRDAAEATSDPENRARARASAVLVRRSRGLEYTPKGPGDAKPIDIVDPDSRQKAMAALLDDTRRAMEPKVREAAKADTLLPIYELLTELGDMAAVELASTRALQQTGPLLQALGERARSLIGRELRQIDRRVETTLSRAGEVELLVGPNVGRRGLHTEDREQLRQLVPYLERIAAAAREGRGVANRFGNQQVVEQWEDLVLEADEMAARVEAALKRQY